MIKLGTATITPIFEVDAGQVYSVIRNNDGLVISEARVAVNPEVLKEGL